MRLNTVRGTGAALIVILLMTVWPAWAESTHGNDIFTLLEKKYGLIDPSVDPQINRIQNIFERVQNVADKRGNRMPQLHVVNKQSVPWAIALPDGHILLSLGAVQLCYRNVSQEEGDTRIAFVLGHELAHLTKNDFWDMEVYQAIAGDDQPGNPPTSPKSSAPGETDLRQRLAAVWNKETEADDLGFLYAGISGYPVQTLLDHADQPQQNFFQLWTKRTKGVRTLQELHPPPEEREAFLRARLDRLTEAIPFFRFGLRLALLNHCEQAVLLLRHFLQIFPAREVYNNLGACHLQRAQQEMKSLTARNSYWLPILFDASTRADPLITGRPLPEQTEHPPQPPVLIDKTGHDLELAVDYLEQATDADAAYLPARLNLATAYFYQGDLLKARGALKESLRIAPNNRDVAGWHALILFLDNQENGLGEAALPPLARLASQADAPASLIYNHAILSKKAGRNTRSIWRRLATRPTPLPARYARMACKMARISCAKVQAEQEKPFPWTVPVPPGTDLDKLDRVKLFANWHMNPLGWLQEKQQWNTYRRGEEMELLEQDGYVTMVVLRGGILGTSQVLKKKVGSPLHVRPLAEGEVCSYDPQWAVLVRDGRVREAWIVHKKP